MPRPAGMAHDTEPAGRIRFLIGTGPGVTGKKMSGGLAFGTGANMAISASGQGGALARAGPAASGALIATANPTLAVMGGRTMHGWLRVSSKDLETGEELTEWVNRAVAYARRFRPSASARTRKAPNPGARQRPATATSQPSRPDTCTLGADQHRSPTIVLARVSL
jgi:hypothetical protein